MAYTIPTSTTSAVALEDYMEYVESQVDLSDEQSIVESGAALRELANNRRFIAEHLNRELGSWRNFQARNRYTSQVLLLGKGKGFFVRAIIWSSPYAPLDAADQDWHYAYEVPHDHNFTFLTAGHFGSGYETVIYEYDRESTSGKPGDPARLSYLETTTLPQGKVMMYRACKDVHIQKHAKEFSVSLNLMVHPPGLHHQDQYYFDVDAGNLGNFVATPGTGRVMLCRLAGQFGDGESVSLLHDLALRHGSRRVRAEALASLAVLEPSQREEVANLGLRDKDPFVKSVALELLMHAETVPAC